eukprot:gene2945-3230_t
MRADAVLCSEKGAGQFRFCFQCGTLEPLAYFIGDKRNCQKRLDHRRKVQAATATSTAMNCGNAPEATQAATPPSSCGSLQFQQKPQEKRGQSSTNSPLTGNDQTAWCASGGDVWSAAASGDSDINDAELDSIFEGLHLKLLMQKYETLKAHLEYTNTMSQLLATSSPSQARQIACHVLQSAGNTLMCRTGGSPKHPTALAAVSY